VRTLFCWCGGKGDWEAGLGMNSPGAWLYIAMARGVVGNEMYGLDFE
jgi:hypothetical protein